MSNKMTQSDRLDYLLEAFKADSVRYKDIQMPSDEDSKRKILRSLMNIRMAGEIDESVLAVQDEYLKEAIREKGITDYSDLKPVREGIYLWQGDITTLRCDAIVNAANSGMTGCYQPCHNCIDNCIHTYAGVQLRNICAEIMQKQGYKEPTGKAKITPAFNLPCKYVIHTVGPIVQERLTETHKNQLASCYTSCLEIAEENNVRSIAFCCISTGVFGFPQREAAEIAVRTVKEYKDKTESKIEVIFDVFGDEDYKIYRELLG